MGFEDLDDLSELDEMPPFEAWTCQASKERTKADQPDL